MQPRLVLVLFLALALRGMVFLIAVSDRARFFTLDAGGYVALARDLRGGYVDPRSELFALGLMRTPGYPVFASLLLRATGSVVSVVFAQIALSLATVVLVYFLARRMFGARAARAAALALAIDPVTAIYVNQLQPETLFTLLVVGATVTWWIAGRDGSVAPALATGALLGLAVLTRPIGVALPVVFLALVTRSRVRTKLAAALLLPFIVVVGGWIGRNAAVTGVPLLSTIDGINLLEYRAAGALAEDQGLSLDEARARLLERLADRVSPAANPAERSRAQRRLGLEVLRERPWAAARSAARGALRLLAGNGLTALSRIAGAPDPERTSGTGRSLAAVVLSAVLAAIYLGALLGAIRLARESRGHDLALLLGPILYFVIVSAGGEANTRFRFPAVPFLALLAGVGWTWRHGDGTASPPATAP
jgi:Dolichyl-phosphate-mannose-protein mannosyltransferase